MVNNLNILLIFTTTMGLTKVDYYLLHMSPDIKTCIT